MSKLRAGSGFGYILKEDRGTVTEPQFQLRVLSADDNDRINDLRDDYLATDDKSRRKECRNEMLRLSLFDGDYAKVTSVLTDQECWELISGAIIGAALSTEERKKFVLPQQSETDLSVNDVAENV